MCRVGRRSVKRLPPLHEDLLKRVLTLRLLSASLPLPVASELLRSSDHVLRWRLRDAAKAFVVL